MLVVDPASAVVVALAAMGVIGLAITFLADRAVSRTLRRRPPQEGPQPPISVLKPVKGLDDGLFENLSSMASQTYSCMEILVGALDPADPALAVARQVAAAHPQVDMRVVVCPDDGGLNPKVTLLRHLSGQARFEHLLVSDSNVRVPPGYLSATARELADPDVALVTNPVVGVGEESLGALFENLQLVTYIGRMVAFAGAYLGRACVIGKSMLFRKADLASIGGWSAVRDVLAEDYLIGNAFQVAGRRVAVSPQLVTTHNERWPVERFVNRHLRWGQMRRRVCVPAYLLEPLFNPHALFVALALVALATGTMTAVMLPLALLGMAARMAADRALLQRVRGGDAPLFEVMLLAIAKDLLMLGVWAVAGFRRTVDWRGNLFVIRAGTRLERPHPRAAPLKEAA
jgi:ceramide glucosyltransferase